MAERDIRLDMFSIIAWECAYVLFITGELEKYLVIINEEETHEEEKKKKKAEWYIYQLVCLSTINRYSNKITSTFYAYFFKITNKVKLRRATSYENMWYH